VTLDIEHGIQEALAIRREDRHTGVLFAGNSLIYEGVSPAALRQGLPRTLAVHVAGVPGSTYDDWRYGLRSLFERGGEPDMIVFGISPSQFLRPPVVTALPVSRLWRSREIFAYCQDRSPGLTALSDLLLEHFSTFFYMRDVLRIYVRKAIPGYEAMLDGWARSAPTTKITAARVSLARAVFKQRLSELQQECSNHARFVLIVVPTHQAEDAALEPALRGAADELAISVIEPVGELEWDGTSYQADGYHLTSGAAIKFSRLTSIALEKLIEPAKAVSIDQPTYAPQQ
jgi:hypothetical protein